MSNLFPKLPPASVRRRIAMPLAALVWALGGALSPALADVPVSQSPLIIQQPLPPNVVLMLDDSGSMAWDYMPDAVSNAPLGDQRNASVNRIYYNPKESYLPPPMADGNSYPPASMDLTKVYEDGFLALNPTDVTRFKGAFKYYDSFPVAGTNKYLFAYTDPATGTTNYVGQSADDCAAVNATSCRYDEATRQNVANWFSYYRTRMLMAKSGVMNAFSTLDAAFRVGFGSIGGSNASDDSLGGDRYAFTTSAQRATYQTGLAVVKPFGDGGTGTQKNRLWNWLQGITPTSWTPLRGALDAVGKYYGTEQPWLTLQGEAGYVAGAKRELACRQSYTILTTDGFWNGDTPADIGDVDGIPVTRTGANGQTYRYRPAAPYSDGRSNTLADVAMKYWVTDLRGTPNEVPTSTEDPAFWQHMTTFTLGMGFEPTGIQPAGTTVQQIFDWAKGGKPITGFSWPAPVSNNENNIADLVHAAVNGHGGFYSAASPKAFADGLKDALKRASERVGTGASLAANSTQLKTGTMAYQANYYTTKWKGDLKALEVDPNTGAIATVAKWNAATALPIASARTISTSAAKTPGGKPGVVVFTDANVGSLSPAQQAALGGSPVAQNRINYLRGDATLEQRNGGGFRNRDTPLGDIVNSQPVYVGPPDPNLFTNKVFAGSDVYHEFATGTMKGNKFEASAASKRAGRLYVAANDGMLHGFDADAGRETFAYLPGAVLTAGCGTTPVAGCGLSQLANLDYGAGTPHQYFNDGELTVADVYIGSPGSWKTVLVGTTGRGLAKAIYALDITDPTKTPTFMWERAAGDGLTNSSYIGQIVGKPVIAQTADGKWSVLMGNGYNSQKNVAALLQFDLATGDLSVHEAGVAVNNGLAAPAVWMDTAGTGVATVAYAGDLNGMVWSFALNDAKSTGVNLFVAKGAGDKAQPITGGLLVGRNPATSETWLFFGTGKYLDAADLTNRDTQTWYGVIVQSSVAGRAVTSATKRTDLAARSITEEAGNARAATTMAEAITANAAVDGKSGWYIDLRSPVAGAEGERMVTPNQFQGNLLLGTTRIPQATDPCNPSGRGWIMALDPFNGTNPSAAFFDVNGDGMVDIGDTVNGKPAGGIGFSSLPNNPIFVGSTMLTSFDNGSTSSITTSGSTGALQRVSWRELMAR